MDPAHETLYLPALASAGLGRVAVAIERGREVNGRIGHGR
jgi:hypothetical protein